MTSTSRKAPPKTGVRAAKEEAAAPAKKPHNPVSGEKKAVAASTRKAPTSVKLFQEEKESEKLQKPARWAKAGNETDKAASTTKPKKIKLLRDSYSVPKSEHKQIAALKKRCIDNGRKVKKSYLLRAGIQALALMDDGELLNAVERVK